MISIIEQRIITATDADILAGTRLNAIPFNGTLTFQVIADLANATNNWALTIQLPGGDVPVDGQIVFGINPSIGGVMDDRQLFQATYPAITGGHFLISLTETGAAIATWRAVLRP